MRTLFLLMAVLVPTYVLAQQPDTSRAGNEKVAEIMRTFGGRGVMADQSAPTPATEAVKQFQVRDGFEIELMASEPDVSQPLVSLLGFAGANVGRPLPPIPVSRRPEGHPF